jgi:glycosyl transferase family 2
VSAVGANPQPADSILAPPPHGPLEPGPVPTFSVVIAAYQVADTVGDAVASALAQTVPPHEVIVCDDGSTDDIEEALEPYRDLIVFLREEHRGVGAAKDIAARAATGDFVTILDADDVYLPRRNEAVGRLASARPDLDLITTNCYIEAGGRVLGHGEDNWRFEIADQRRALLERNFVFGNAAVRRSRLIEVGGFDRSLSASVDWDCWLRLVFSGSAIGQVDERLARCRLREESLSSDKPTAKHGALQSLEKAARTLQMSAAERLVLERSLAERRRRCDLEEARLALKEGAPDARRRSRALATKRGYAFQTRLKGALGAVAPRAARRLLLARDRKRWIGGAEITVRRPDP